MKAPETREQEIEAVNRKLRLISRRLQCCEEIFDRELREMWDEFADISARVEQLDQPRMTSAELDAELKRLNGIE